MWYGAVSVGGLSGFSFLNHFKIKATQGITCLFLLELPLSPRLALDTKLACFYYSKYTNVTYCSFIMCWTPLIKSAGCVWPHSETYLAWTASGPTETLAVIQSDLGTVKQWGDKALKKWTSHIDCTFKKQNRRCFHLCSYNKILCPEARPGGIRNCVP